MDMCLLTLIIAIDLVSGFYPREPPHSDTKTHFDITNAGTLQAIAEYISRDKMNETSPSTTLEDFFGKGTRAEVEMLKTISTVRNAIADTKEEKRNIAYVHCYGDQIELAHYHVMACRQRLSCLKGKSNMDLLRRQVGECLYTIQSFYSNTNWVEMFGRTPYLDFGIKGRALMNVSSANQDTCTDMPGFNQNCEDNLIVNDTLTSGYFYGRGNIKPARPVGATTGKCSHGGISDESRKLIAKCGINKETTLEDLSPHYHLHNDAYYAAVAATKNFLIAEDTGILGLIGSDTFDSLFQIIQPKQISLSVVFDYTGSMNSERKAVKDKIIQIITSTMGSDNEPADYVLSLFNDPVSANEAHVFTNGLDMIQAVSAISVKGGGDCPELAADGIIRAIGLSRRESTVLVFTDADAKDEDRENELVTAAKDKDIKVTTLLTGHCSSDWSRRRRETHGRFPRSTNFYYRVAASTGGIVYNINKDAIAAVLDQVIETIFPSYEDTIVEFTWGESASEKVYVDDSIQVLKISIKTTGAVNDADFIYPDGTIEDFTSVNASRIRTVQRELIMSIQIPSAGIYSLRNNTNVGWKVHIRCQSSITVEGEMLQRTGSGDLVSMKGSPLVGKNYTYIITAYNLENGTCNFISTVNKDGGAKTDFQTTQNTSGIDIVCSAVIDIPDFEFRIRLDATDRLGNQLYRTLPNEYTPARVELIVTASTDDTTIRKEREIEYEVINSGTEWEIYDIRISDDLSSAVKPKIHQHNINISAGGSVHGTFTLLPDKLGTFEYSVSVQLSATNEIKQRITKALCVIDIERPACSILVRLGTCDPPSLNTANCSKYTWNSVAIVAFSGTELERIFTNEGNTVLMQHNNLTGVVKGPLGVIMSGDCCTPSVTVSAVDIDGYFKQCHLELSDGNPVQSVEPLAEVVTTPEETTTIMTTLEETTTVLTTQEETTTVVATPKETTVLTPVMYLSSPYSMAVAGTVCLIIIILVIVFGIITCKLVGRRANMKENLLRARRRKQRSRRSSTPNTGSVFANNFATYRGHDRSNGIGWYMY